MTCSEESGPQFVEPLLTSKCSSEKPVGSLSFLGAVFQFVTGSIGVGLLVMPTVMGRNGEPRAGIFGGLALLFVAAALQWLANCCICEAIDMTKASNCASLEALAKHSFGEAGQVLGSLVANITTIGSGVTFVILLGTMLDSVCHLGRRACIAIVGCGTLPLTFCPLSNTAGLVAVVATVILIPMIAIEALSHGPAEKWSYYSAPDQLGSSFCTILFANGVGFLVPAVRAEMQDSTLGARASNVAMVFCIFVYGTIMCLGYYAWGNAVPGNVLDAFQSHASVAIAQSLLCINVIVSYTVFMNSTIVALAESLHIQTYRSLAAFRVSLALIVLATAYLVPCFNELIDMISALTIAACNFLLPPACFWALRSRKDGIRLAIQTNPAKCAMHLVMMVSGCLAMLFGIPESYADLLVALSNT